MYGTSYPRPHEFMAHEKGLATPHEGLEAVHVIKIGGALVGRAQAMQALWKDVRSLQRDGTGVIVVHGGGPQMTAAATQRGHQPTIIEGRRVTTDLDLVILREVMCGRVNSELVSQASAAGCRAVGLTGADAMIVQAHRRPPVSMAGKEVDFGWVGDVDAIDPSLLYTLIEGGYTPILATLARDTRAQLLNVNGDTVAREIAISVGATCLWLMTETGGVRRNVDDPHSHLSDLSRESYQAALSEGWIQGGMKVKLDNAFSAIDRGVGSVAIAEPGAVRGVGVTTRIQVQ